MPCNEVTELIDLGADIQAKTAKGSSAMALADKNGHTNTASAAAADLLHSSSQLHCSNSTRTR